MELMKRNTADPAPVRSRLCGAGHAQPAAATAAVRTKGTAADRAWSVLLAEDDVLVAEMIGLAKKTGDVTRVPISLPAMTFQQSNFWTSHFGGVYIFRDVRFPAAISSLDWRSLGEVPVPQVMDLTHRNQIADWLERNGLTEPESHSNTPSVR